MHTHAESRAGSWKKRIGDCISRQSLFDTDIVKVTVVYRTSSVIKPIVITQTDPFHVEGSTCDEVVVRFFQLRS